MAHPVSDYEIKDSTFRQKSGNSHVISDAENFIQSARLPIIPKFEIGRGSGDGPGSNSLKSLSLNELAAKLKALQQLRKIIKTKRWSDQSEYHDRRAESRGKASLRSTVLPPTLEWWTDNHTSLPCKGSTVPKVLFKHASKLKVREERLQRLCTKAATIKPTATILQTEKRRVSSAHLNTPASTSNRNSIVDTSTELDDLSVQSFQPDDEEYMPNEGFQLLNGGKPGYQTKRKTRPGHLKEYLHDMKIEICTCVDPVIPIMESCRFCFQTFIHKPDCSSAVTVLWPRCLTCSNICNDFHSIELSSMSPDNGQRADIVTDSDREQKRTRDSKNVSMPSNLKAKTGNNDGFSRRYDYSEERSEEEQVGAGEDQCIIEYSEENGWENFVTNYPTMSRCSYTSEEIDDRSFIEMHEHDESYLDSGERRSSIEIFGTGGGTDTDTKSRSEKSIKKKRIKQRLPTALQGVDWTKVHREAYIQALSVTKAKQLLNPLKGKHTTCSILSNLTTPSFVYSYFSTGDKIKTSGLKSILKETNLYDYYPKPKV